MQRMVYVAEEAIAIGPCRKKAVAGGISSPRITGAIQLACKLSDSYLQDQASIERKSWLWETRVKPSIYMAVCRPHPRRVTRGCVEDKQRS